jgi:peroxiredoxin
MATEQNRVGAGLPAVDLIDMKGEMVDIQAWKGNWTLLVFLRHLG